MFDDVTQDEWDRLAIREHAAYELHKAQNWPVQSEKYQTAKKALDDLTARKGYDGSRDDRRLRSKYLTTMEAEHVTAVQHAHSLGLLDAEHVAAAKRLGLLNNE